MASEWRKSSHSSGNGDNCIEVATNGGVLIRDTMNRDGASLRVSAAAWATFLAAIR